MSITAHMLTLIPQHYIRDVCIRIQIAIPWKSTTTNNQKLLAPFGWWQTHPNLCYQKWWFVSQPIKNGDWTSRVYYLYLFIYCMMWIYQMRFLRFFPVSGEQQAEEVPSFCRNCCFTGICVTSNSRGTRNMWEIVVETLNFSVFKLQVLVFSIRPAIKSSVNFCLGITFLKRLSELGEVAQAWWRTDSFQVLRTFLPELPLWKMLERWKCVTTVSKRMSKSQLSSETIMSHEVAGLWKWICLKMSISEPASKLEYHRCLKIRNDWQKLQCFPYKNRALVDFLGGVFPKFSDIPTAGHQSCIHLFALGVSTSQWWHVMFTQVGEILLMVQKSQTTTWDGDKTL